MFSRIQRLQIYDIPTCHSKAMRQWGRGQLKCDGTRAVTRFRLSAKRTSLFKTAETSVQSTTSSWSVRISGSNDGYTMFRGSVKGTGYPLHSPVSHSFPLPRASPCAVTFQPEYTKWGLSTQPERYSSDNHLLYMLQAVSIGSTCIIKSALKVAWQSPDKERGIWLPTNNNHMLF